MKVAMIHTPQRTCLIGAVSAQVVVYRRRDILVDNRPLESTPPQAFRIQLSLMCIQFHSFVLPRRRKKSYSFNPSLQRNKPPILHKLHPSYPIRKVSSRCRLQQGVFVLLLDLAVTAARFAMAVLAALAAMVAKSAMFATFAQDAAFAEFAHFARFALAAHSSHSSPRSPGSTARP